MARAARRRTPLRPRRHRCQPVSFGLGIDVVELERFTHTLKRGGTAFLDRVFTPLEQDYANRHQDPVPHLAARFAAKEAIIKAMSELNPIPPFALKDIEIRNNTVGKPCVVLTGPSAKQQPVMCRVSLTHSERIAAACAFVSQ